MPVGVFLLLVLFSHQCLFEILGPDKNKIINILKEVNWQKLANQLNFSHNSISENCGREVDLNYCCRSSLVNKLCELQGSLIDAIQKLVEALEELEYVLQAKQLFSKFLQPPGKMSNFVH